MSNIYLSVKYVRCNATFLVIIIACVLRDFGVECVSAAANERSDRHALPLQYRIEYNEDEVGATIRILPYGRRYPMTLIDVAQETFAYVEGNNCFLKKVFLPNALTKNLTSWSALRPSLKLILKRILGKSATFYATPIISEKKAQNGLRLELRAECENRQIWQLQEVKPKLPTYDDYLESYERNRTIRSTAGSHLPQQAGKRTRRSPQTLYSYRKVKRVRNQPAVVRGQNPHKQKKANGLQADDPSSSRVQIADDVSYISPSFNRYENGGQGFRHYEDFHEEFEPPNSNGFNVNGNKLLQEEINNLFRMHQETDQGTDVNLKSKTGVPFDPQQEDFQFPETIVKDGQVFYRHDANVGGNDELNFFNIINRTDSPPRAKDSLATPTDDAHRNGEGIHGASMPGFDFLMEHVRQVGAQRPIISAAIAGASVRGSSEGSSSRVIGSAVNGGYFAASANGYDGKGGEIHSHVHGTGESVSGGASAVAPDKDGEAFIHVDHSERGLSLGHSSTQNGEALVIADVDRQSQHQDQFGDNTSSYKDEYNTKILGHTFGEAKSQISSKKNRNIDYKHTNEEQFESHLGHILPGQRKIATDMFEGIMEKVHQPNIVHSAMTPINENFYFKEEYTSGDTARSHHPIDHDGLLIGAGVPPREGEIQQVITGIIPEGGNKSQEVKSKDGVVGLATFPYGQLGTPPGPGELLERVPQTVPLPSVDLNKVEDEFYNDYLYDPNNKLSDIPEDNEDIDSAVPYHFNVSYTTEAKDNTYLATNSPYETTKPPSYFPVLHHDVIDDTNHSSYNHELPYDNLPYLPELHQQSYFPTNDPVVTELLLPIPSPTIQLSTDNDLIADRTTQPDVTRTISFHQKQYGNFLPNTIVLPVNVSEPKSVEGKVKDISPGGLGSTQVLEPAGPGQPHVNIITMDANDKRKLFYQREGTPLQPGEKIPGAPGYRVPPGFRGSVVYGHSAPVEVNSRRAVKGYNAQITLHPQKPSQNSPIFASVSGPEASQHFTTGTKPGVHITLSAPSTNGQNINSRSRSHSLVGPKIPKHNSEENWKTKSGPTRTSGKSWNDRKPEQKSSGSSWHSSSSWSSSNSWNSGGNSYDHQPYQSSGQFQESCGYYSYNCQVMNGVHQNSNICTPQYIDVACCC